MIDFLDVRKCGAIDNGTPTVFANSSGAAIQAAVDSDKGVLIPPGCYYVDRPIVISRPTNIEMVRGWASALNHNTSVAYRKDRTVIYTDQNIDLFQIESNAVHICGGVFDFSAVQNHSGAAFRYRPWWSNLAPYRETRGQYDGSLLDWWVVGNKNALAQAGNGTNCVFLDWENSPSNTFIYGHQWRGRADYVKSAFAENRLNQNGKVGQNSTWNSFEAFVWGAKQPLIVKAQTRSQFAIKFQAQYGLAESEKDLPILDLESGPNRIKAEFYDLNIQPSGSVFSNSKTIKAKTPNAFEYPLDIDRHLMESGSIETGLCLYETFDAEPTRNQAASLDKRGVQCTVSTSAGVTVDRFTQLFRLHGFPAAVNMPASDTEFAEIDLVWPFGVQTLRLSQLNFTLDGPNNVPTGIKQLIVKQYSGANVFEKSFTFDAVLGAFPSVRRHQVKLNGSVSTDRLTIRLQGSHSSASYLMTGFYLTDDRSQFAPYVQV